jgi:uncharacterized coiled-coil DUF342 family protein
MVRVQAKEIDEQAKEIASLRSDHAKEIDEQAKEIASLRNMVRVQAKEIDEQAKEIASLRNMVRVQDERALNEQARDNALRVGIFFKNVGASRIFYWKFFSKII